MGHMLNCVCTVRKNIRFGSVSEGGIKVKGTILPHLGGDIYQLAPTHTGDDTHTEVLADSLEWSYAIMILSEEIGPRLEKLTQRARREVTSLESEIGSVSV